MEAMNSEVRDSWMSLEPSVHLISIKNLPGETKVKRITEEMNFLVRITKIFWKFSAGNVKIQDIVHLNANQIRNTIQIIRKKSWTFREHIHIILSMHFLCQVKISKKFGAQTVIELSIYAMRA